MRPFEIADLKPDQEAQTLLAAIVESSDDAIVSKSLDGVIRSWNSGAQRIFGYTAEQAVGRHISLIIPPERLAEEDEILRRLRAGERVDHFETVRRRIDGAMIDVSLTISPIRNSVDQIIGASKIARDITAQKRAQVRLATQDAVTRALAESSTLEEATPKILRTVCEFLQWDLGALWRLDEQTHLLRCCAVWRRPELEVSQFEAETRQHMFAVGVSFPGRVWARRQALWVPDFVQERSFPRVATAAREGLHGAFGFPIELNGDVLGVIEFFSREVRQRDDELLEMMAGLGSQLGQFLERKRAEEQLRLANRRKDEFLATLAHELRNPLAPICSGLELMKRAADEPSLLQQARETIERQVKHMVRLVDDLLDVSRITRDKMKLRNERVELASVIHQAVDTCRPLVEGSQHELILELPRKPIYLHADAVRLAQVLSNLLNNACKYTPSGGQIRLSVAGQGEQVVIKVKDNGIGIAPDKLLSIFEMFGQVDQTLERSRGGLGIGLTLVERLVQMHGGSVQAFSEGLGRGSEFVVRLPVIEPAQEDPRPTIPDDQSLTGRRVLVVDDNEDSARSLAMLLQVTGNEAQVVHDGATAIETAKRIRPDIVLLDIGLPGKNGYDVCRAIRQQPWSKDVLLVAITGWGQEEDRRKSQEAGFDGHLVKPVAYDDLVKLLADLPKS
jgi:PAS domain S-box-containing protein